MSRIKFFFLRNRSYILFTALAVLSLRLFFWKLGQAALVDNDEATYAQVVKDMLSSGHLLSLTYFGGSWFDKPPLYFWIAALCVKIFGLNEFALRLPSALTGIGTVLLVWAISLRLTKNDWIAFGSGLVLLTTSLFVYAGREVRLDIPVTFFIMLGFYCFIRGIENSKWNIGMGVSAALGVLTKSAIGLLMVPIVLLFSIFNRSWGWLTDKFFWIGACCSLLIALPWHLYESMMFGSTFWNSYFFYHIVERFQQNILGGNIPFMVYFTLLYQYVEPWSTFFLALCVTLLAILLVDKDKDKKRKVVTIVSYLSAVVLVLLVFSIAQTKLFNYLDPLFPFAALFIAAVMGYIYERLDNPVYKRSVIGIFALMVVIGLFQTINLSFALYIDPDDQALTQEERSVGLLIRSYPPSYVAYVYELNYFPTLDFYGGRQVKEFTNSPPAGSMLLAFPTQLMKDGGVTQAYINSSKVLYSGTYLTLVAYSPLLKMNP